MDIKIPNLAESVTEGDLAAWLKKDGERVEKDDLILELETDKATVELAAEASGTLKILVQAGETVHVGDVVGRIVEEGEAEPAHEAAPAEKASEQKVEPKPGPKKEEPKKPEPERKVAPAKKPEPERPEPEESEPAAPRADEPGTRRERMTRLRRRIAERLVEAQRTAAILTTFNEIDMTEVLELRR